jgi:exodeoxyribonuclease VII large subunit
MNKQPLTVSALTKYIKYTMDHDPNLTHVLLKGEVSNFKHHSRGHFYFTLKDDGAQMSAIMFSSHAKNVPFKLEDGLTIIVEGFVSVYLAGGSYSINVTSIQLDGVGELYLKFEQLKEKLSQAGLFDPKHKKPIVPFPGRIGVITSDTGAAIRDIISTIERRYKACEVILFPTLVQGERGKDSIIESIKRANQYGGIDTIILGRGGGSIEDLWCFNEEEVAMAIYESQIPIISAVGHETDFTISDFVSDVRAATPTAAAEIAVPNTRDVILYLDNLKQRMSQKCLNLVNHYHHALGRIENSYVFQNPVRILEQHLFKCDRLMQRLENKSPKAQVTLSLEKLESLNNHLNYRYQAIVNREQHRFTHLIDKLELVNPLNLLTKGYSIAKKEGKSIRSVQDVAIEDRLTLQLTDGALTVEVLEKGGENHESK